MYALFLVAYLCAVLVLCNEQHHFDRDEILSCPSSYPEFWSRQWGNCALEVPATMLGFHLASPNPYDGNVQRLMMGSTDASLHHVSYRLQSDGTNVIYAFSNDNQDIDALIFDSAGEAKSSPAVRQLEMLTLNSNIESVLEKSNVIVDSMISSRPTPRRLTQLLLVSPAHLMRNSIYDKLSVLLQLFCNPTARARSSPWYHFRLTLLTDSIESVLVSFSGLLAFESSQCVDRQGLPLIELVELRKFAGDASKRSDLATGHSQVLWYADAMLKFQDDVLASHSTAELEEAMTGWASRDPSGDGMRCVRGLLAFWRKFDVLVYRDLDWDLRYYGTITLSLAPSSRANIIHGDTSAFIMAVYLAWLSEVRIVRYVDITSARRGELGYFYPADGYMLESTTQLLTESPVRLLLGPLGSAKPMAVLPPILPPLTITNAELSQSLLKPTNVWTSKGLGQQGITSGSTTAAATAAVFRVSFAGGFRSYACPGAFIRMVHSAQLLVLRAQAEAKGKEKEKEIGTLATDPSALCRELNRLSNSTICPVGIYSGRFTALGIIPVGGRADSDTAATGKEARKHSNDLLYLQFTMFGDGHLRAPMLSLMHSLGVAGVIHTVLPEEEEGVAGDTAAMSVHDRALIELLEDTDLLVEPCSTYPGSAFVFPLATSLHVPVVLYNSCGSREWLFESTSVRVSDVSILAMAEKVTQLSLFAVSDTAWFASDSLIHVADLTPAAEIAHNIFGTEAAGKHYLQLFDELVANTKGDAWGKAAGRRDPVGDTTQPLMSLESPSRGVSMYPRRRYYPSTLAPMLGSNGTRDADPDRVQIDSLVKQARKFNRIWKYHCHQNQLSAVVDVAGTSTLGAVEEAKVCDDRVGFQGNGDGSPAGVGLTPVEKLVADHITVSVPDPLSETIEVDISGGHVPPVSLSHSKLFCAVFTTTEANEQASPHRDLARTQLLTWGKRCDGFVAFSNVTDWTWNTLKVDMQRPEHYHNMWQKVRNIWTFVFDNFGADFDWFIIGGDDLYVLVENLRLLIDEAEARVDIQGGEGYFYLGRPLRSSKQLVYNTGGAGYLLNKHALRRLVPHLRPQAGNSDSVSSGMCFPHENKSVEDVFMGYCLAELGIFTADTKDTGGRERFHWQAPETEFHAEDTYYMHQSSQENFGFPVKAQLECCSNRSVTFQNLKPAIKMATFHAYLYN